MHVGADVRTRILRVGCIAHVHAYERLRVPALTCTYIMS